MFLVGLSLIADFYLHFAEEPRYPRLALDVLTAFYLNQGVVRDFFERRASGPPERMRMP